MNEKRRKAIRAVYSVLEQAINDLETIRDEEQESYDNLPEGLQQSDRGMSAEQAVSELEDALSNLESARDSLDNVTSS